MPRDFLLGKSAIWDKESSHPLIGIRFISLTNGIELVGEIISIFDGVTTVEKPMIIRRDPNTQNRFEFIKFTTINPLVGESLQIHVSSMVFSFKVSPLLEKNYLAARSGLVSASSVVQQID